MERAIAEMEKIKRAEEIYSRRKENSEEKKQSPRNIYKFLFEFLLFIDIVIIVVAIQNQNYIFTKDFIKQVNSYNVNIKNKAEEFLKLTEEKEEKKSNSQENKVDDKAISGESNNVTSALVENEAQTPKEEVRKEPLTQEEQDILDIKNNYSLILPVNGTKTSSFGERSSQNSKVTKHHTGVDIAIPSGTEVKSASKGTVIQVSDKGDFGKHIRIQDGNLVILYAHCSKICVKEGQEISQGEKIAESRFNSEIQQAHIFILN